MKQPTKEETPQEHPYQTWCFLRYCARSSRVGSFYDFVMTGLICSAKPVVRFDHPGRALAEKYFSARLLGERRKE